MSAYLNIEQLAHWLTPLTGQLQPTARRSLGLEIARALRQSNQQRMRAQRGPEGQAWAARKTARKAPRPLRVLYKARDGHVRELEMSSYQKSSKGNITGYDKEAGGLRTIAKKGILQRLLPKYSAGSETARKKKANAMMVGLASARRLQARAGAEQAVVQIEGRSERIARVHHLGLRDRVKPGGPEYGYPERALLGINAQDQARIEALLIAHLARA